MSNIVIRQEKEKDYRSVEEIIRETFWGLSKPSCDEHLLAHRARSLPTFIPELDYIAEVKNKIVGNIMFVKAKIIDNMSNEYDVLELCILSVLPEYQNKGIGKALTNHAITKAKFLGYRAIFICGEPDYYPRLGFKRAAVFNISNAWGNNYDSLMAIPLYDGALDHISGRFHENPVFDLNTKDVVEFDSLFPPKEKHILSPIDILLSRLNNNVQQAFKENNIFYIADLRGYSGKEIALWNGMDKNSMHTINVVLLEHGYALKTWDK